MTHQILPVTYLYSLTKAHYEDKIHSCYVCQDQSIKNNGLFIDSFFKNSLFETEFMVHQKPTNSSLMLSKEKHVVY